MDDECENCGVYKSSHDTKGCGKWSSGLGRGIVDLSFHVRCGQKLCPEVMSGGCETEKELAESLHGPPWHWKLIAGIWYCHDHHSFTPEEIKETLDELAEAASEVAGKPMVVVPA